MGVPLSQYPSFSGIFAHTHIFQVFCPFVNPASSQEMRAVTSGIAKEMQGEQLHQFRSKELL